MSEQNCYTDINKNDLEFIDDILKMTVHNKILLDGIIIGIKIAEQSEDTEKEYEKYEISKEVFH